MRDRLIKWIGAKYVQAELVGAISELEAKTRCVLTWQDFDRTLWLGTCDAADFCANRQHLVVGFSDQVPLWAKAIGRRADEISAAARGTCRPAAVRHATSQQKRWAP